MTKLAVLFSFFFLITCTSAPKRAERTIAQDLPESRFPSTQNLDWNQFQAVLRDRSPATVGETVRLLSTSHPEYLKLRTAVYFSRSIQESSFEEPRQIIFGPEARFIFTFNGGPHRYGGAAIETMQYDQQNSRFLFREVFFKSEGNATEINLAPHEIDFENEKFIVSKPNPAKCMHCHANHPDQPQVKMVVGPVWDNDFHWPGVYGSNDDLLYGSFDKGNYQLHGAYGYLADLKYPRSQGRWLDLPEAQTDVELNGYVRYLKGAPAHPRYRYLPPQTIEAGFRKYIAGVPAAEIDESVAIHEEAKRLGTEVNFRPNGHLTFQLLKFSEKNLIARIRSVPGLMERLKANAKIMKFTREKYPFHWGTGRLALLQALKSDLMAEKPSLKASYKKILLAELDMQNEKVKLDESALGIKLIVSPFWPPFIQEEDGPETAAAFRRLKGRRLTRTEIMALDAETGPLADLALLAEELKAAGIDLVDYDINFDMNKRRTLSLHGHDLEELFKILDAP